MLGQDSYIYESWCLVALLLNDCPERTTNFRVFIDQTQHNVDGSPCSTQCGLSEAADARLSYMHVLSSSAPAAASDGNGELAARIGQASGARDARQLTTMFT